MDWISGLIGIFEQVGDVIEYGGIPGCIAVRNPNYAKSILEQNGVTVKRIERGLSGDIFPGTSRLKEFDSALTMGPKDVARAMEILNLSGVDFFDG